MKRRQDTILSDKKEEPKFEILIDEFLAYEILIHKKML